VTFVGRNKVAIVGYAQSRIERRSSLTLGDLTVQTALAAIDDAGMTSRDVDGFITTPLFPTLGSHAARDGISLVTAQWLAQHLDCAPNYVGSVQAQLPGSVAQAVQVIVSGSADCVVVHRALHNPGGRYHQTTTSEASGPDQWVMPQGFYGPIAAIALTYNEYVGRYGVPADALSSVAIESRKNGARIPWSYWYDRPLSAEAYFAAPLIDDPMRMLDCDIPVDGAVAFVLTSGERARDLVHRPVYISGFSESMPGPRRAFQHWPYDDIVQSGTNTVRRLWDRIGLGIADIDLPQVYDGFSPLVYFWLELLGLAPVGEAHRLVADGGIDSDDRAAVPALASGGSLGNGRMHGVPQMLECYLQLAGRAGVRQRNGLTTAIACQGIPHAGGIVAYSNEAFEWTDQVAPRATSSSSRHLRPHDT
jgi:acetyl-CoA acetyltransferase